MVQQHLEDAELGHVVGYGRLVGGGLGLAERQSGDAGCCHRVSTPINWRNVFAFTGNRSQHDPGAFAERRANIEPRARAQIDMC
nr:hypothetical protein MFLOJ_10530 [Mycobacterium florentinum]